MVQALIDAPPDQFHTFQHKTNGFKTILQFVLIHFEHMGHTLRPDGQARPALSQDAEKATKWTTGPKTRLGDHIASRNLHGIASGFDEVFLGPEGGQPTWLSKRPGSNYGRMGRQDKPWARTLRKRPNGLLAPKHDFVIKSLHRTFTETSRASTKFSGARGGAANEA